MRGIGQAREHNKRTKYLRPILRTVMARIEFRRTQPTYGEAILQSRDPCTSCTIRFIPEDRQYTDGELSIEDAPSSIKCIMKAESWVQTKITSGDRRRTFSRSVRCHDMSYGRHDPWFRINVDKRHEGCLEPEREGFSPGLGKGNFSLWPCGSC